jgi:pyruvate carboxylase subunit B
MKYFVTLGNRTWEIEVEGERITIDGQPLEARLVPIPGGPLYHLSSAEGSSCIAVEPPREEEEGTWTMGIAGQRFPVQVTDERAQSIGQLLPDGRPADGAAVVSAPMPGLVVRVDVEVGQQVAAGTGLVVVEAMKMQNELRAQRSGVIAVVHVVPGQTVEKGAPLITLQSVESTR